MEGRLLLNVIIAKSAAVLELLSSEDQPLLVWGDSLLILDLGLDVLDGVGGLDLKGDSFTSQGLDEDLHSSSEPEDEMKSRLLLDVIVGQGPAVFELLSSEDQPLLVWGNPLLVLDLGLDVLDGVRGLNLQGDGLTSQCLDEDLHSSSKPEDEMEGGLLLDVVVAESPTVLELLTSEDQPLLVRGDPLLVLDLGLDVLDRVGGLHLKSDGLTGEGFDKDLHSSTKTEHKMEGGLLLDVVVAESATILELLTSEDQPLLVWGDP